MRNELELLATIEKYLNNEMTAGEKAAFERELSADAQLQEAVTLQQEVMKGIDNLIVKQQIKQARKRFYRNRNFTRWGLTGLVVVIAIVSILYYRKQHHHTYNENQVTAVSAGGDEKLPSQAFLVHAGSDTIVETKGGLVIQVPANGFLDENKQPVQGDIELTIKEALDAASIMGAGLSSTSGNELLESAGMFQVNAQQKGKMVSINPAAGLRIELPTDSLLPGMKLFKGNRLPDGRIDWVDPKSLEQDLTPVDILSLNFYPPGYLDSLAKWGYESHNKKFTDSLYYSFSILFQQEGENIGTRYQISDSTPLYEHPQQACGINPAKIKAIWNNKFQNTLLATRQFEERLAYIHQSNDNSVLDLYINNLDKNLSAIDFMAAQLVSGKLKKQFLAFTARHDGQVKISSALGQKLRQYYETKSRLFMEAVAKTNREFWEQQAKLDELAAEKKGAHEKESRERTSRVYAEELKVNLKSVYGQLGYDTSITPRMPNSKVYKIDIIITGWYNVDRFVKDVTASRTTGSYTDPETGKTATIKYQPVSFQINKPEQYDTLYVYLLPDKLNSFIRIPQVNGQYLGKLNELLQYKLVCIAYKNGEPFYYSRPAIEAKSYWGIELSAVTQPELTRLLNQEGGAQLQTDVKKEMEYFRFCQNDLKRQKRNAFIQELWYRVYPMIYHCAVAK
ncbi:hypothetical protein A4D02_17510 [Niastella koreensis]|uniref:Uncharacterized protein n=2 Tax=Niastella koreensis TaxID=354356 RepID=G8TCY2_NIAKG|nr:hypothetical protein [Niastella koreensis]AEV97191.1 hypothetical protein Niako_0810 [Niastella koreensis GR20-10]OQP39127.1 hypothetical protein A4D02_17510 [Niastella koreensis]